jgi:thermostable 8-oxoguanine DNA glycosylase
MIDPKKITNYKRTQWQLQEFLLYCICVAGKRSEIETRKLDVFLEGAREQSLYPFDYIRQLRARSELVNELNRCKIAPYKQRYNSFEDCADLMPDDLIGITIEELQEVRGISTKTSRFFLTHSSESYDEPVLDTHILRFLTDRGHENVPKATPQNPKVYEKFAEIFRSIATLEGMSVADFDLKIWKNYSYKGVS